MKKTITLSVFCLICLLVSGAHAFRYFAEIDKDGVVQRVIVADSKGWCQSVLGGTWVETFMGNAQKKYAGQGFIYYTNRDDFSSAKPSQTATLDANLNWIWDSRSGTSVEVRQ